MNLGERLAEFRKLENLSQLELAELLNTSRQTISKWETGASLPSIESLISLSKLYKVSLDELINGSVEADQKNLDVEQRKKNREYYNRHNIKRKILIVILSIAIITGVIVTNVHLVNRDIDDDDVIETAKVLMPK